MNTPRIALGLMLTALSAAAAAAPFEMAAHGESYIGPKTLTVQIAPSAKGDKALIKILGINHPWDGKVVMADVREDPLGRTDYVVRLQGQEWVLLKNHAERGIRLSMPGTQDMSLTFQRADSLEVVPAHIGSDYERPGGAVK